MKRIETDFMHISILSEHTVLVEAMHGVEVDAEKSRYANQLIANEMPADYGMIINRKADYSIVPLEVYNILNSLPKLKAIAIVNHKGRSFLPAGTEEKLFKGRLETFTSVEEAHAWLESLFGTPGTPTDKDLFVGQ